MKAPEEFNVCTVVVKDGSHFIRTPKGEIIEGIIFTRVTDEVGELTTCLVKLIVNLED